MERSFSFVTGTGGPPPMIWPFTATNVSFAPLPSGIWLPTVAATGAPAVVPAAATFHWSTQPPA